MTPSQAHARSYGPTGASTSSLPVRGTRRENLELREQELTPSGQESSCANSRRDRLKSRDANLRI